MPKPVIKRLYQDFIVDEVWKAVFDPFLEIIAPESVGTSVNKYDQIMAIRNLYHKALFEWFGPFSEIKPPGDRMLSCMMNGTGVETNEAFRTCKLWQFCPFCRFRTAIKTINAIKNQVSPDCRVLSISFLFTMEASRFKLFIRVIPDVQKILKAKHWFGLWSSGVNIDAINGDQTTRFRGKYVGLTESKISEEDQLPITVSGSPSWIQQVSSVFKFDPFLLKSSRSIFKQILDGVNKRHLRFGDVLI